MTRAYILVEHLDRTIGKEEMARRQVYNYTHVSICLSVCMYVCMYVCISHVHSLEYTHTGPYGEWKKVPKKSGVKVYTLPPKIEKYAKRVGADPDNKIDTGDASDSDEEGGNGTQGYNGGPPIEGNPITWYKGKNGWTQMAQDHLGWIDPTASYGRQIEREKEDRKKEEEFVRQ